MHLQILYSPAYQFPSHYCKILATYSMKMYLKNVFVALLASLFCANISCAVTRETSDLLEKNPNYQVSILIIFTR